MEGIATPESGTDNTSPAEGAGETWYGGFPDELKGSELINKMESPEALAKSHLELNNKYTELQASLPQLPGTPDEYKFDVPEGVKLDEESVSEFRKFAFENKIPTELANKLIGFNLQIQKKATERAISEFNQKVDNGRKESERVLKGEWTTNYDQNVALAQRVANKYLPENIKKYLNDSGFGDNPELVKAFYEIGKVLSEDTLAVGQPAGRERTRGEHGQVLFDLPNSFPAK